MHDWARRAGLLTNLTGGLLVRSIALFVIPLLVSGFLQQLYSTVDLLFVSNYLGSEASAALGVSTLLAFLVFWPGSRGHRIRYERRAGNVPPSISSTRFSRCRELSLEEYRGRSFRR